MGQQHLNFGTSAPNDGEELFPAFTKIEANTTELFGLTSALQQAIQDLSVGAIEGNALSLFAPGYIPDAEKAAILARTSTYNARPVILDALSDVAGQGGGQVYIPPGRFFSTGGNIEVPTGCGLCPNR